MLLPTLIKCRWFLKKFSGERCLAVRDEKQKHPPRVAGDVFLLSVCHTAREWANVC